MTLADKDVDSKVFFYDGEVRYFCGSFLTADGMATASPQFGNRLDFLATKLDSCVIWLMLLLLHALNSAVPLTMFKHFRI